MKDYYLKLTLSCLLLILPQQACSAETWNLVKWVVDGDTVVLDSGQKVRYIGINAPELAHDNHNAEPYADEAKRFNALLVHPKKVRLEFDKERIDPYKRLLAYVFLKNGTFVNAEILSNGYAFLLQHRPNLKYNTILLQAQRSAMVAKKGIWLNWVEKHNPVVGLMISARGDCNASPAYYS